MVMKNSIVIGKGMVGKATMHEFGITKYISKSSRNVEDEDLGKFKYYFLCLPTPTIKGEQDDSLIREWIVKIAKVNDNAVFIIRSTVLPRFCQSAEGLVKLVHVPEFLTEKTWKEDSEWPDIVVIGADDEKLRTEVAGIFKARHKGATFFLVDTVTSELIKYAINTFYALKVVFANQIYDYAQQIGANYETIKNMAIAIKGSLAKLQQEPFYVLYSEPTTPLMHSEEALEKLLFMAENRLPMVHTSGATAGGVAPVSLAGIMVVSSAEVLSGLLIAQLKNSGLYVVTFHTFFSEHVFL